MPKHSRRWEDNIKIGLKEIGSEGMDLTMAYCWERDNKPSVSINGGAFLLTSLANISFSRRALLHGVRCRF